MKRKFIRTYWLTPIIFCCLILHQLNSLAQSTTGQLMQQGYQYFQQGNYQQAINSFHEIIKANPENQHAYIYLIAGYLRMNKGTMSLSFAEEAIEKFPKSVRIKWLLAEANLMNENYQEALQQFLNIQNDHAFGNKDLPLKNVNLSQKIGNLYRQIGAVAFRQDSLNAAIKNFKKARQYLPEDPKSYVNLAFVYSKQQNWDKMLNVVNKGLEKFPENTELIKLKANAYYKTENHEGLLQEYKKLYNKNPDDLNIALAYAEVLMANKKMKEAMKIYTQLLKRFPEKRKVYEAVLKVNDQMRNFNGKIRVLQKMRNHFPEDYEIIKSLAASYMAIEKWEKAIKVYDTLARKGGEPQWANMQIARIYEHLDSLDQALNVYQELLAIDSGSLKVNKALAGLFEKQGKWQAALAIYKKYQNAALDAEIATRKGFVLEKLGRENEAIKAYKQAVELQPQMPKPYFYLAKILIPQKNEKAFGLLSDAVTKSLNSIAEIQKEMVQAFQGNNKEVINPLENEKMVQSIDKYKKINEEALRLLSRHFEVQRVNKLLNEIVNKYPSSGRMFYLVGNHYKYHNNYKEAVNWYQQAVQKTSDLREAHLALGETYEAMNRERKAIIAYERALALDESKGDAYDGLIRLYRKQNNLENLWRKWMARHRAQPGNKVLKEHLIEALHKDGQHELSQKIIKAQ